MLSAKTSKKPLWSSGRWESDFTCFTSFIFLLKLELTVLANIRSSSAPAENISSGIKIASCPLNYMFTWNLFLFSFLNIIIFAWMFAGHSCCIHVYADECVCMIALPLCTSVCALMVNSFPLRSERSRSRQQKGSEAKYSRLKVRHSSLMLTTTSAESREGEQKNWNKFTAQPSDVSEMKWCSLLRWNMTARVPSCISCLAQEEPIWSWALDVLCCCVACCCNGTSHFCWCF